MLVRIGDEVGRRPVDVRVQRLGGASGVASKRQILQFAVFGSQVAAMITR